MSEEQEDRAALKDFAAAAEVKIAKLELSPGDVLVVQMPKELVHKASPVMARALQSMLPKDVRVVVMADDIDLKVITSAELLENSVQSA